MQNEMGEVDAVGPWSEAKLDVIREYMVPYSQIMTNQKWCKSHWYIDAFAGPGDHVSRKTGAEIPGSPHLALDTNPPFSKYLFIDKDPRWARRLERMVEDKPNGHVRHADANELLINKVFPALRGHKGKHALLFLDPYKLQLDWNVVVQAAETGAIDMFLFFPIMAMQRGVLHHAGPASGQAAEDMTRYWGDRSWIKAAYESQLSLFKSQETTKRPPEAILKAFRKRLRTVAGWKHVPAPRAFSGRAGGPVYYLYFASHNPKAAKIAKHVLQKHRGGH